MVRDGIPVLVLALEIQVGADIQVQLSIPIEVGGGQAGEGALGRRSKPERSGPVPKPPGPVVEIEFGPPGNERDEVLDPGIAEIEKQGLSRIVEDPDARLLGDVAPVAIRSPAVEPVRQASRLANVQFIPAIRVDVADSEALVAIHADPRRQIQSRPPVRDAFGQLFAKARHAPEKFRSQVGEKRRRRSRHALLERFESEQLSVLPSHPPQSDPVR